MICWIGGQGSALEDDEKRKPRKGSSLKMNQEDLNIFLPWKDSWLSQYHLLNILAFHHRFEIALLLYNKFTDLSNLFLYFELFI